MSSSNRAAPTDEPLMGMPEPEPREPSAGDLVAAWCAAWSETHGGLQPHGSVVRRVAGVCRNVAKDCADVDAWRDAWRACKAAGRLGRYDVVAYLAAPVQQTRGNHYLALAQNSAPSSAGALAAALAHEPRAIGGA